MPEQPLIDLIEGALSDLDWVALDSQDQLEHYAYQVAGTVGLMMCGVFGVRDPRAVSCRGLRAGHATDEHCS